MSEFRVQVVRIGPIVRHENADTLSITRVWNYPVILRTGEFKEGDLAVYVPVDAIVPKDDPRWAFLEDHRRIKAKRLRGVFSMGLLTTADPAWAEGQDVQELLGITKYEPVLPQSTGGEVERGPATVPVYTDIESLRRWPMKIAAGEAVQVTLKIHGANGRFVYTEDRLWCGSHRQWKKQTDQSLWWKIARRYALDATLAIHKDHVFYGEVYGNKVQDLTYGFPPGEVRLAIFDVFDLRSGRYLPSNEARILASQCNLEFVPVLYTGSWSDDLRSLAEGPDPIGKTHPREGIVIKPIVERFDAEIGRVILKLHGQDYLTRKENK